MHLDAYSRFYRRHTGRYDDILAGWPAGIPARGDLEMAVQQARAQGDLGAALRRVRNALMLRLIEADLLHETPLSQVCHGIGCMAEVAIRAALHDAHVELQARHGVPRNGEGAEAQLLVVGMGKLGGDELNVSSDIDLVFVFDHDGQTDGAVPLSNFDYFARVVRQLVPTLSDLTSEGFVFRVDTRLRPNGDSGPPVVSLAMLEEYFQVQGRGWERFAWLKSRVVSPQDGQQSQQAALDAVVEPFVWRRYLDFAMLEALRSVHRQIRQEAARRASARPERANDLKLGRGGIREIEFIVQLLQIVRGGRMPQIRDRNTLHSLQLLGEAGLLEPEQAQRLSHAYEFLRRLEHRVQYLDDAQTHCLPSEDGDLERIAASCEGFAGATRPVCSMLRELDAIREFVAGEFDALLHSSQPRCVGCRKPADSVDALLQMLAGAGIEGGLAAARLRALAQSPRYAALSEDGRSRMLRVIDKGIGIAARQPQADAVLARLIDVLEAIGRRETYLAFFAEQSQALARLVGLLGASNWAADYVKRNPMVVDELIVPPGERFSAAACRDECERQRQRALQRANWDAGEGLDVLRRAFHAELFRILVRDLDGRLHVEQVADELSDLADAVIGQALEWAWDDLPRRHRDKAAFAVIAYGKLGGKELGYGADLDVVFVYDDQAPDAPERYGALARKLVWWLTASTPAGSLFEIDTRLRPNGNAGLLVISLDAFEQYQLGRGSNTAWTWEHQALTRARFCAGDPALGARFEAIRAQVLGMPRDGARLRAEIGEMRRRVAEGHPNRSGLFDLKHDPGGMVDVEFAVQALVLEHASAYPQLVANIGNIALLRLAEQLGLLPSRVGRTAAVAYRRLRRLQHAERLRGAAQAALVDPARVLRERAAVHALSRAVFGQGEPARRAG